MIKHKLFTYLAFSIANILAVNAVNAAEEPTIKQAKEFIINAEAQLFKSLYRNSTSTILYIE